MNQIAKHTSFQHGFDNGVDSVAEVLHDGQWVIEHRLQPTCRGVQVSVERLHVDSFAGVKKGNRRSVVSWIQRYEDLRQAMVDCCRLQSCEEMRFTFLGSWIRSPYRTDHRKELLNSSVRYQFVVGCFLSCRY